MTTTDFETEIENHEEERTIEQVIGDAGPLSDAILQIEVLEDGRIGISTETNAIALHAAGTRVVFEVDLVSPSRENQLPLYRAMLIYNMLWEDTGHIRLALSGAETDASAVLIGDLVIDDTFESELIAAFIEDINTKADMWREILASELQDEDPSAMIQV